MRTRVKNNVLDAISFPVDGAKLENNMAVLGGVTPADASGVQNLAIIVNGDQVYLFPIGRVFTVVGGPNAGTYTVIAGTLGNGAEYNTFPLSPHIANTTEIPVAAVSSIAAGGTIDGFGIDANVKNRIVDMADPTLDQDAATKKYVDDTIVTLVLPLLAAVMPPGSVAAWGGASAIPPTGWLMCDGTSHLSATYPALFANIGTTYGVGTNDFMVPDLRGRFPLGKSNGSGSNKVIRANAQTLANVDGDEGVVLGTTGIPPHNHPGSTTGTEPAHNHTGTVGNGGAHDHQMRTKRLGIDYDPGPVVNGDWMHTTRYTQLSGTNRIRNSGSHTHSITGVNTTGSHSHSITINNSTGGGSPHDNVPPYLTIQYIIKV